MKYKVNSNMNIIWWIWWSVYIYIGVAVKIVSCDVWSVSVVKAAAALPLLSLKADSTKLIKFKIQLYDFQLVNVQTIFMNSKHEILSTIDRNQLWHSWTQFCPNKFKEMIFIHKSRMLITALAWDGITKQSIDRHWRGANLEEKLWERRPSSSWSWSPAKLRA